MTDPTGRNIDEVALARTTDGALHVVWLRKDGTAWDLVHGTVDSSGRPVGQSSAIVAGWKTIGNPALVASADGLVALFPGVRGQSAGDPYDGSIYVATAPASGAPWTLGPTQAVGAKTTASPGVALARDGTPILAWPNVNGVFFHHGIGGAGDQRFPAACCSYQTNVATDAATGEVVVGWSSNANRNYGLYTLTVEPAVGEQHFLPGSADPTRSSARSADQRVNVMARRGAGGVYVAYCAGYPACTSVNLWRHGGGAPLVVARVRGARVVNGATAPEGRLWVMWMAGNRLYATRSNRAATRFGPTVSTAPPSGTQSIWKLTGEGGLGPLDLFTAVTTGDGLATWQTRLFPALTLSAGRASVPAGDSATVTFTVTDAGDPVGDATVTLGDRTATSDGAGRVVFSLRPAAAGRLQARAESPGYVSASAAVAVTARPAGH
jgi:hypothetical protein